MWSVNWHVSLSTCNGMLWWIIQGSTCSICPDCTPVHSAPSGWTQPTRRPWPNMLTQTTTRRKCSLLAVTRLWRQSLAPLGWASCFSFGHCSQPSAATSPATTDFALGYESARDRHCYILNFAKFACILSWRSWWIILRPLYPVVAGACPGYHCWSFNQSGVVFKLSNVYYRCMIFYSCHAYRLKSINRRLCGLESRAYIQGRSVEHNIYIYDRVEHREKIHIYIYREREKYSIPDRADREREHRGNRENTQRQKREREWERAQKSRERADSYREITVFE